VLEQGARDIGIFAVEFEGDDQTESWGLTSVPAEMTPREIVADMGGMTVAELIRGWSEMGATRVAVLDVEQDVWIGDVGFEGLDAAGDAFLDCYERLPL
jgi:hypothetical protein